tara:strand:+ start:57312 stop:57527 length:216 start_codon:yes stop_codon:yes gene_type:complete
MSELAQQKAMLLMLKGAMSELDADDQAAVLGACEEITTIVKSRDTGLMALGLCSLELGIQEMEKDAPFSRN